MQRVRSPLLDGLRGICLGEGRRGGGGGGWRGGSIVLLGEGRKSRLIDYDGRGRYWCRHGGT